MGNGGSVLTNWADVHAKSIPVDVVYFNSAHETLLRKSAVGVEIQHLVNHGFSVPIPEFLTYFLFHRTRSQPSIYTNYSSVKGSIGDAYGMLGSYLTLSVNGLCLSESTHELPSGVTEYIGECFALAAMNRIHGVSEADWKPIPLQRGRKAKKTLDYEMASNGIHIIQVEAKGSVSDSSLFDDSEFSSQQKSILEKKNAAREVNKDALRYGAITTIPRNPVDHIVTALLDPVPDDYERSPRNLRLLARQQFIRWLIWLVAPRSPLATALATRWAALEALEDPFQLDGISLAQSDGKQMEMTYLEHAGIQYSSIFAHRSRVADGPAGGIVFPVTRDALMFVGLRSQLVEIAYQQQFGRINEYEADIVSVEKKVMCVVPAGEFRTFDIDRERLQRREEPGAYVTFELNGILHYSREGLVFGVLPLRG
jgi:hypothetical protein